MTKRALATAELLLILPAALFMTALAARTLPFQLARTADQIVMWYAGRQWTLWVLLIALPMAVLVSGGATLLQSGSRQTFVLVAAGIILAIVVLHMLAN